MAGNSTCSKLQEILSQTEREGAETSPSLPHSLPVRRFVARADAAFRLAPKLVTIGAPVVNCIFYSNSGYVPVRSRHALPGCLQLSRTFCSSSHIMTAIQLTFLHTQCQSILLLNHGVVRGEHPAAIFHQNVVGSCDVLLRAVPVDACLVSD